MNSIRISLLLCLLPLSILHAQKNKHPEPPPAPHPWLNASLDPDHRADMVQQQLTFDEKLQLVHGIGWGVLRDGDPVPPTSNFGAGMVVGIPRLGIPDINLMDSAVGIRMAAYQSRYATLLPSTLGAASSFDPEGAFLYGSVIGRELRDWGSNMSIGGGVDLTREPRNGRNFEYAGEDPVLAGTMTGNLMRGVIANHVMSDIKHFAVNDEETGRNINNVVMGHRALRETDLLAFQIAIGIANPSAVMCSYNKVNTHWACENDYLLNKVLKRDFGFKGFVVSDWEATHSTVKAANAGLDMEMPGEDFFGKDLRKAIADKKVPMSRVDDMVHRILRSMFAAGVVDYPFQRRVTDPFRGLDDAQHIAEESIVLLKNRAHLLPLAKATTHSIALIGSHADVGMLSGGGSAQVDAPGGNAVAPFEGAARWGYPIYFPTSPLKYIQKAMPSAKVSYNSGDDLAAAVALAKKSDVAFVFVNQFSTESRDFLTLSLPNNQDALVAAVSAANPKTIVVLETGGPVSMPWIDHVAAVFATWYPGIGGAQALANLVSGEVNPSGKLPITFARTEADLPTPVVPGLDQPNAYVVDGEAKVKPFDIVYPEPLAIGYRWYELKNKTPLFAFGYGLSYTSYAYSALKVDASAKQVTFRLKNTGARAGTEIAQVYVQLPESAGEPFKKLVAFKRVTLKPMEEQTVTLPIDPAFIKIYVEEGTDDGHWELPKGDFTVFAGGSSATLPLHTVAAF